MKIIGIVGWKDSGKTFFVSEIIKKLKLMNYIVASIKHAHHNFDIDKKNTDSYNHRKAGSDQVIISSANRWAKITELRRKKEKTLNELLEELENADFVIIEGFKNENHPKIEIVKSNTDYLYKKIPNVVGLISDIEVDSDLPQFKKNEIDNIINFILKEI